MLLLVSGATTTVHACEDPRVGYLVVPRAQNQPILLPLHPGRWAMDNGAFSDFDAARFVAMLDVFKTFAGCLFVTAPDIVGDCHRTLDLFFQWAPFIRAQGYRPALVAQDGLTVSMTPWASLGALFIGGTTEFKLGAGARTLAAYASARSIWLHMGRVNSRKRIHYAASIGCDSIDGTGFSRWSAIRIPLALRWMQEREEVCA